MASWSREAGAAVLVKTDRPHRCARVRGGAHGQLPRDPSPTPISGFQPFSCRPSGDGSGEKL